MMNQYEGQKMTGNALIIIQLPHGGYVVKDHDPMNNKTGLLFAGSLDDCMVFMHDYLTHKELKSRKDTP